MAGLVLAGVLVVGFGLASAGVAPAAQAQAPQDGLSFCAAGEEPCWDHEDANEGPFSVRLAAGDGTQAVQSVGVETDVGLDEIDEVSFAKEVRSFEAGWNPNVLLGIDLDGDGEYSAEDFAWKFDKNSEHLNGDTFIICEDKTGLSSPDDGWAQVDVTDEYACWNPAQDGDGSGSHYGPLSDYADASIDGIPTDAGVQAIKVHVGGSSSWMQLDAGVDSLTLNGDAILSGPQDLAFFETVER